MNIEKYNDINTNGENIWFYSCNGVEAISSLKIAEITGKEHYHVLRDIDDMLEALKTPAIQICMPGEISANPSAKVWLLSEPYLNGTGHTCYRRVYYLNYTMTITLLAGYDTKLRYDVIEEWDNFKKNQATKQLKAPQTYIEALKCLLAAEEEKEALKLVAAKKHEENKNIIEARNNNTLFIIDKEASYSIKMIKSRSPKTLKLSTSKIIDALGIEGILYRGAPTKNNKLGDPLPTPYAMSQQIAGYVCDISSSGKKFRRLGFSEYGAKIVEQYLYENYDKLSEKGDSR